MSSHGDDGDIIMTFIDMCLSLMIITGFVLFVALLLQLYRCARTRYCVDDSSENDDGTSSDDHVTVTIREFAGIEPSVLLRSIPVVDFEALEEDGAECVVCLSQLADGDKAKLLPTCNHWFHAHCIDMWLQSHSTCPICRKRVGSVLHHDPRSMLSPIQPPAVATQDATSFLAVTAVVVNIPAIWAP